MHLMDKNEGLFELNKIFFFNILKRYFDERILRFSKFLFFFKPRGSIAVLYDNQCKINFINFSCKQHLKFS